MKAKEEAKLPELSQEQVEELRHKIRERIEQDRLAKELSYKDHKDVERRAIQLGLIRDPSEESEPVEDTKEEESKEEPQS